MEKNQRMSRLMLDMNLRLLFGLAFFYFGSVAAFAGDVAGNGGDIVYCDSGQPFTIELLDFYEAKAYNPSFQIDLAGAGTSLDQKVTYNLAKIDRVSKARASNYKIALDQFFEKVFWVRNTELTDIPDSNHLMLPEGCRIRQIAIQMTEEQIPGKKYLINQDLWDMLNDDQKAGLLFHEVIYTEALANGQTNSVQARKLNTWIIDKIFQNVSARDFNEKVVQMGFSAFQELPGLPNLLFKELIYSEFGQIIAGIAGHDYDLMLNEYHLLLRNGSKLSFEHNDENDYSKNIDVLQNIRSTLIFKDTLPLEIKEMSAPHSKKLVQIYLSSDHGNQEIHHQESKLIVAAGARMQIRNGLLSQMNGPIFGGGPAIVSGSIYRFRNLDIRLAPRRDLHYFGKGFLRYFNSEAYQAATLDTFLGPVTIDLSQTVETNPEGDLVWFTTVQSVTYPFFNGRSFLVGGQMRVCNGSDASTLWGCPSDFTGHYILQMAQDAELIGADGTSLHAVSQGASVIIDKLGRFVALGNKIIPL